MSRVACLVVGYKSAGEIGPLAASVRTAIAETVDIVDIYMVDNSGDPEEYEQLATIDGVHRLVANTENLGYGGGMNLLARNLDGSYDWLLITNPDVRFTGGSIRALIEAADRHPDAALYGPLIRDSSGNPYPSARAFPSLRTGVGHVMFSNTWPSNPWTARYHQGGATSEQVEKSVDWLSGACILVRPAAFEAVDGFDDAYFMYFEDVDLAWRLGQIGYRAIYAPSAEIVHSGAHSTASRAAAMRDAHHRSASRFLGKKYSSWWLSPLRWSLQFGLFLRRVVHR
jgi:N-acetylglucosaminyl-diphospho-decaprenol L-rhamnosyltransferase